MGARTTHGLTTTGTVNTHLDNWYDFIQVVNYGASTIFVKAVTGGTSPAPTVTGPGDDIDAVPAGQTVMVPVTGQGWDQGVGGVNPGVDCYVSGAGTAAVGYEVRAALAT